MSQPGSGPLLPSRYPHDRLLGQHLLWEQQPDDLAGRLVAFLDDPLLDVRRYAADRLCDLGQQAVPELLDHLDRAADARRAVAVLASTPPGREALVARPGSEIDLLEEAFSLPDLTAKLSRGLIRAMVACEDSRVDRRLSSLMQSRWSSVRAAATTALRARGWERHCADQAEPLRMGDFAAVASARARLGELLAAPVFSITVEMLHEATRLDDPRVVPLLQRLVGWRGMMAQRGVVEAARAALDRALAADAGVPDGALSHAAEPAPPVDAAALSRWRADGDEGAEA